MLERFYRDKEFLDNKYHKANEPFDPFQRMSYHGYAYDERTGLSDEEIQEGLEGMQAELAELPHPIAKAKAVRYVLENTRIDISPHDYFVGFWSVNRLPYRFTFSQWWHEIFGEKIPHISGLRNRLGQSNTGGVGPDVEHIIPDWNALFTLGFAGIRARAAKYRQMHCENGTLTEAAKALFEGIDIHYGAIIGIIDRMYHYALAQTHEKAQAVAACLLQLRDGAPTNIYEAMQLIYIYFMICECFDGMQVRSLGNGLDSALYPFYCNDLKNGTYTRAEIRELLTYFLYQWTAIGNYWGQPFYMGGTTPDGKTKYNELSRDILWVYETTGIYNPKVQIKVNRNTPDDILFRVFRMIRKGNGSFVFCCEPGFIHAVMQYGATEEEARDFEISGCYETRIRANEVIGASGYLNALKAIEYVFTNGYEARISDTLGLRTGALSAFRSFDDFYFAVLRQWQHLIERYIEVMNGIDPYLPELNPSLSYTATIEGALQRGVDALHGVKFSNSVILSTGFASLVDSVMAVKHLVYDTHATTLEEYKQAIDADWAGYEHLRAMAKRCPHKYGNGDKETDAYAEAMSLFFANSVNNRPNGRGGVYKAAMHSARKFLECGKLSLASPDGRRAGEEQSKNASPVVGMDKNGVTALIGSVCKARPDSYLECFSVDVMLHPSAVDGDEGLSVMKALLMTDLESGGMSMQFNVFHSDMLRDAQEHPEKYQNLQVRVCGWNVLWNNLSRAEQDAYILRAENIRD